MLKHEIHSGALGGLSGLRAGMSLSLGYPLHLRT